MQSHRPRSFALALSLSSALAVAACGSSDDAAPAPSGPAACAGATRCVVFAKGATEDVVQEAFASAKPGDVLSSSEGTYSFSNQLVLAGSGVSVVGAGPDKTILDFSKQVAGSEGLFSQNVDDLRFEGFTVRDTKGNGLKVLNGKGVVFRSVNVEWTGAEATNHGPYGIYPVQCRQVLIERCMVAGASDSGIYVGQSEGVVVRRNEARENVAGIEIENTFDADVYENDAHDNTGGILVFDMPGLPQKGGHGVRVHANKIHGNNTANFAPKGNIVGKVPGGTGFFVMANHDVEVFDNVIEDNQTVAIGVISFFLAQQDAMDADYYPYPSRIHVHDNKLARNGTQVDLKSQVGLLLLTGKDAFPGGVTPDVVYDGIVDAAKGGGTNPMEICVKQGSFGNMHADLLDEANPDLSKVVTLDAAPYACTLPPLPAVQIPQAK